MTERDTSRYANMAVSKDAFRQFQEELAALDRKIEQERAAEKPAEPPRSAKDEFLAFRERHGLSLADVVALFPPAEGIEYLRRMVAQPVKRRRRKTKDSETSETP